MRSTKWWNRVAPSRGTPARAEESLTTTCGEILAATRGLTGAVVQRVAMGDTQVRSEPWEG